MGLARTLIRYHTQRHTNTPTENTSDQKTGTHRNIYQLHLLRYALTAATCIYCIDNSMTSKIYLAQQVYNDFLFQILLPY